MVRAVIVGRWRRRSLLALALTATVAPGLLLTACRDGRSLAETKGFAILNTGDVQGSTEPCSCKQSLGGLARRASAVAGARRQGDVLLLEAGNVLSAGYDPEQGSTEESAAVMAAMEAMHYDAMAIGDADAANGHEWLRSWQEGADFAVLSANLMLGDRLVAQPDAMFERGGVTVAVLGLTAMPSDALPDGLTVTDPVLAAQEYLRDLTRRDDVIVVLGALGPEVERRILAEVQHVDVLVGGGTAEPCGEVSQTSLPAHVCAGPYGEYLGITTLTPADGSQERTYSFRPVPLDATFAEDREIAELLRQYLR